MPSMISKESMDRMRDTANNNPQFNPVLKMLLNLYDIEADHSVLDDYYLMEAYRTETIRLIDEMPPKRLTAIPSDNSAAMLVMKDILKRYGPSTVQDAEKVVMSPISDASFKPKFVPGLDIGQLISGASIPTVADDIPGEG